MSEKVIDFDEDFISEANSLSPGAPNKENLTTVSEKEYPAAVIKKQGELKQIEQTRAVARRKTYLSSELPVRPCTVDCSQRAICVDFNKGRVSDNDLCKPELRQIKKWQAAFRRGELDEIKDDVGAVAGAVVVQIRRLLEQAILDGVVIETVKEGKFNTYTEKIAHPALAQTANLCKILGINLNDFLMTPKSVKEAGPSVQVDIGVSFEEIKARFAAKYGDNAKVIDVE